VDIDHVTASQLKKHSNCQGVIYVTLLNSKSSGFDRQRKDYYSRNPQILGSHQVSQTGMLMN